MEKAKWRIFYSWQSDLPNRTNRGFIETALEKAAKSLRADDSIQVDPVIDRDTNGVPGSPDIAGTIFNKIEQSQVFVCDVSIINQGSTGRLAPNPNVLIELGYAMKALEAKRIILIYNNAYGIIESLPFDLRTRRVIQYTASMEVERADERKHLEQLLTDGLRVILDHLDTSPPGEILDPPSLAEQARSAIQTARPDQQWHVRQYMKEVVDTITSLTPVFTPQEHLDEQLIQAIQRSTEVVSEFAHVVEDIARMNAAEAAQSMFKSFEDVLNLYTFSPGSRIGDTYQYDHDLAKFLGHELFVTFFAALLQEQRWELIATLLDEDLYAREKDFDYPSTISFSNLSQRVSLLDDYRKQRLNSHRMSHRYDLLAERHTQGVLATIISMEQFVETDYFLFLRAQLQPTEASKWIKWIPWSVPAMQHPPRYIQEAIKVKGAQKLLLTLNITDISTLRTRLTNRALLINELWTEAHWHHALENFDFNRIGTQ